MYSQEGIKESLGLGGKKEDKIILSKFHHCSNCFKKKLAARCFSGLSVIGSGDWLQPCLSSGDVKAQGVRHKKRGRKKSIIC